MGGGQVDFGENFVWGTDFRLGEYPCFMIYKWIIVDNRINLCHDYSSPLGGGQVDFGENFVWGTDFRLGEYPCFMIYKWIIVDNRSKNR